MSSKSSSNPVQLLRDGLRSLRSQGLIQTLDSALWLLVTSLRSRYYAFDGPRYGLREAVLWPWNIDVWQRNGRVVAALEEIGVGSDDLVLDVGAGGDGIWKILQYSPLDIGGTISLDIDETLAQKAERGEPIVGDGCHLPLQTNSVEVAVSVDSLEHVPSPLRDSYISEMKRVARSHVVLHFPIDSAEDEAFVGERSDEKFQDWHITNKGHPEPNTAEHLEAGHMIAEELENHFSRGAIQGIQNEQVWLTHMKLSRIPVLRVFTGLLYYLVYRRRERDPPHHACFIVDDVTQAAEQD